MTKISRPDNQTQSIKNQKKHIIKIKPNEKVIVVLALVMSSLAMQAQTKVGHINSSALIEAMPEADSIQKN